MKISSSAVHGRLGSRLTWIWLVVGSDMIADGSIGKENW